MLRLNQLMQQLPREIDCGVIMSPTNRQYFTGFLSSAGMLVAVSYTHLDVYKRQVNKC